MKESSIKSEQDGAETNQRDCAVYSVWKIKDSTAVEKMEQKGVIMIEGKGRGTKYIIK